MLVIPNFVLNFYVMDKAAKIKLRTFLADNVPLGELRRLGFFGVDVRDGDCLRIARLICDHYGYKSIYEYKKPCTGVVCDGNCNSPTPYCRGCAPVRWERFVLDVVKMVSEDSWLN